MEKKAIIVGGGFAGISAALELEKEHIPHLKIVLVSNRPHFEFHASLYRVLTGHSPLEVCIPLEEIFKEKAVEVVQDTITGADLEKKQIVGESGSIFNYDYLVLAAGSETNYYGIEGLQKYSFNINSITECLRLKRHLHESFSECKVLSKEEKKCNTHIVVVGAGASGCEVAGELALYTKKLAQQHNIEQSMVKVTLIHSGPRILDFLPEEVSGKIANRLEQLGVEIVLNKRLMKEDVETIYFPDIQMKTKTLVWTAGVQPNRLYKKISGLSYDEKGRVKADEHLQAVENVFVVGDGTTTKFSGMARPAMHQGAYAAKVVSGMISGKTMQAYAEPTPQFIIPVGPGWAATNAFGFMMYGMLGWVVKRARDMRFFMSILPPGKALTAFEADKHLTESCSICSHA